MLFLTFLQSNQMKNQYLYTLDMQKKGFSYLGGTAYFHPYLGGLLLDNSELKDDLYSIPIQNFRKAYLYHIVFHLSEKSGFPISSEPSENVNVSSLALFQVLKSLKIDENLKQNLCLENMYEFLKNNGWVPEIDTLRRISENSNWLNSKLKKNVLKSKNYDVVVFVLRDYVFKEKLIDKIKTILVDNGHKLVKIIHFNKQQKNEALRYIRGGEWGAGSFSKSAGDPAAMIVTLNYNPKYIDYKVSKNSKAYKINQSTLVKNRIRTIINRKILRTRWTNFIHSADDEIEAFNYLDAVSEKQI